MLLTRAQRRNFHGDYANEHIHVRARGFEIRCRREEVGIGESCRMAGEDRCRALPRIDTGIGGWYVYTIVRTCLKGRIYRRFLKFTIYGFSRFLNAVQPHRQPGKPTCGPKSSKKAHSLIQKVEKDWLARKLKM